MSSKPHQFRRGIGAFTILEMVLALFIVSIILLGVQSAILLASRTSPDRSGSTGSQLLTGSAIDQLNSDLSYATSFTIMTPTMVEFTVPDRNNDASPETIRYSWSGSADDPLLRTVNGGSAAAVVNGVRVFNLVYDKRPLQHTTSYTESGEVLLSSNDGIGVLNLGDFGVDSANWLGQYFKPTLPNGAASWRVTRAKIKASVRGSSKGTARIQIRNVRTGTTTPGIVLDEGTLLESGLTSAYSWCEFTYGNATALSPNVGACLVVQWVNDQYAANIQYQALLGAVPNANLVTTTDAGATWSAPLAQDLVYYVYGTYTNADPITYDYWLTDVRCTLCTGTDPQRRLTTTIRVLNEPQVSGP
jgi:hypothetical protein